MRKIILMFSMLLTLTACADTSQPDYIANMEQYLTEYGADASIVNESVVLDNEMSIAIAAIETDSNLDHFGLYLLGPEGNAGIMRDYSPYVNSELSESDFNSTLVDLETITTYVSDNDAYPTAEEIALNGKINFSTYQQLFDKVDIGNRDVRDTVGKSL